MIFFELLMISVLVSVMCSMVGVFLILRNGSLIAFALSHSILLGIVIVYFITKDLNSPFMVLGATITGLIIVTLVEFLIKSQFIKQDAALGIIYLFVFSVGLILISRYLANTTLSTQSVVTGNIALVPFDRLIWLGIDFGPSLMWITILTLSINIIYLVIFYKELKITSLDAEFAMSIGLNPSIINLSFMFIVSLTVVASFKVAGIVVVVGLLVIPPSTAYLLTKQLHKMMALSILFGILSAVIGFMISWNIGDIEISSVITLVSGSIFILVLFFAPEKGVIKQYKDRTRSVQGYE
ncbi:MAG: metal ABC transporter permease [Candidatus Heimdallarchaeota archaeon]|nr:metal ABC transporter permease [Candidatus Heimdallarchaeota archaeon]